MTIKITKMMKTMIKATQLQEKVKGVLQQQSTLLLRYLQKLKRTAAKTTASTTVRRRTRRIIRREVLTILVKK